jgi:anti-sigma28 factor (negative regulator of flagellin synthesis)
MEITNIPKLPAQKAEESQKVNRSPPKAGSNAYAASKAADQADISPKARQLLQLRESYRKLDDAKEEKVEAHKLEEKLEQGVTKLSSEEIVSSILHGTLFEVV